MTRLTQVVHKNMTLRHSGGVISSSFGTARHGSVAAVAVRDNPMIATQYVPEIQRPLAVLLTWLAAKEKHIEKYRTFWLQKGFDVLTVKMSPYQLLLPKQGSISLVQDLIKFLYAINPHYPDLILHCFSVGAYEFGEILAQINDQEFMDKIKTDHMRNLMPGPNQGSESLDPKSQIEKSIKGVIFDSAVAFEGIAAGVSRSITLNPTAVKALEVSINTHLRLAHNFATKYYERASDWAHSNYLHHAPGLIMASESDLIGSRFMAERVAKGWKNKGVDVSTHFFPNSGHVQHMAKYTDEYQGAVDRFLKKVPFDSVCYSV